ncbi:hypothetical protein [Selenomonas sp. KH1T6]|uniref:hypothetical protein n=1 Tax=Selenomonas sp. KH1T6 TaxID=3158784 RepID=UPI0008A7E499|nr:hypothetical protein SAMN05216583_106145 [Selenomonas ruminantium]
MKDFCIKFVAAAVSLLLLVGAFNIIVDPYDVWRLYRQVGFNQWSVQVGRSDRLVKPVTFNRQKPEVLFLGDSVGAWGLDTDEYARLTGKSSYNFAMLGCTIYEMRRALEYAISTDDELREVMLEVNFGTFTYDPSKPWEKTAPGFDDKQMKARHITLENVARTAFSWQALEDSLKTISVNRQTQCSRTYFLPSGCYDPVSVEHYCTSNRWTFNISLAGWAREGRFRTAALNEEALAEYQRIIDICREHGLKLRVFVPPVHARSFEQFASAWELYAAWARRMAAMMPYTSFEGFNEMTVSPAAEGLLTADTNEYFWDSYHMKIAAGNRILAALAGPEESVAGFGRLVTEGTVEEHLAALAAGVRSWEASHPESKEEVLYYAGFSPLVPGRLQGRHWTKDEGLATLEVDQHELPVHIEKPQSSHLELAGARLTLHEGSTAMYAVLTPSQGGERLYSIAERRESREAAAFMRNPGYGENGFLIREPLWDVPQGSYILTILDVPEQGEIRESAPLAEVIVR